jgi:hypothetical protein
VVAPAVKGSAAEQGCGDTGDGTDGAREEGEKIRCIASGGGDRRSEVARSKFLPASVASAAGAEQEQGQEGKAGFHDLDGSFHRVFSCVAQGLGGERRVPVGRGPAGGGGRLRVDPSRRKPGLTPGIVSDGGGVRQEGNLLIVTISNPNSVLGLC